MKEIVSLNGSEVDESSPLFKIEVGLIEIFILVYRRWIDEIKFSI